MPPPTATARVYLEIRQKARPTLKVLRFSKTWAPGGGCPLKPVWKTVLPRSVILKPWYLTLFIEFQRCSTIVFFRKIKVKRLRIKDEKWKSFSFPVPLDVKQDKQWTLKSVVHLLLYHFGISSNVLIVILQYFKIFFKPFKDFQCFNYTVVCCYSVCMEVTTSLLGLSPCSCGWLRLWLRCQ